MHVFFNLNVYLHTDAKKQHEKGILLFDSYVSLFRI